MTPIRTVPRLDAGDRIAYRPDLIYAGKEKAEVSLISIPTTPEGVLAVLESHSANEAAEWVVPSRAGAIAVVFGPQGVSLAKLADLVLADRSLVPQLADYAETSARTEMLIEAVRAWERNGTGQSLDSALQGFASRYGMAMPALNRAARPEEQALGLMRALNPALATIDPLAPDSGMRLQQSAGLAATVAGLFFGNPVGLASAGGALFLNMRTLLFPGSEFRSALTQHVDGGSVLCAPREPAKSRTQLVYLWAWRIKEPPPPRLEGLPYRVNLGEQTRIDLRGPGVDRIRAVSGEAVLGFVPPASVEAGAPPEAKRGDRFAITLDVTDSDPVTIPGAIEVLGPRPRIAKVRRSIPASLPVAAINGELPAGGFVSVALDVENAGPDATLHLACTDETLSLTKLALRAGADNGAGRLRQVGASGLFLSFGPGAIAQPPCEIAATLETSDGRSEPTALGRVVRLPLIDSFTLTAETAGDRRFFAVLEGEELDSIERTGWDGANGLSVESLPLPVAGSTSRQRLRVVMPWPPPAPKSALYVWLRGETHGRRTTAVY
ncbi:MAG: hypothetical protein R2729_07065 [Bryobacteraceae bacterium]